MRKKVRNFYYHFVVNMVKMSQKATLFMVQIGGLEPPRLSAADFESAASTDSAIGAGSSRNANRESANYPRFAAYRQAA